MSEENTQHPKKNPCCTFVGSSYGVLVVEQGLFRFFSDSEVFVKFGAFQAHRTPSDGISNGFQTVTQGRVMRYDFVQEIINY